MFSSGTVSNRRTSPPIKIPVSIIPIKHGGSSCRCSLLWRFLRRGASLKVATSSNGHCKSNSDHPILPGSSQARSLAFLQILFSKFRIRLAQTGRAARTPAINFIVRVTPVPPSIRFHFVRGTHHLRPHIQLTVRLPKMRSQKNARHCDRCSTMLRQQMQRSTHGGAKY